MASVKSNQIKLTDGFGLVGDSPSLTDAGFLPVRAVRKKRCKMAIKKRYLMCLSCFIPEWMAQGRFIVEGNKMFCAYCNNEVFSWTAEIIYIMSQGKLMPKSKEV